MARQVWENSDTIGDVLGKLGMIYDNETELYAAVAALTAGSGVLVSSDDTTIGYLDGKLLEGDAITLTVGSPSGDETLTVLVKDDGITYAKIQNVVADQRLLGNIAGSDSTIAELTAAQVRTLLNVLENISSEIKTAAYPVTTSDNNKLIILGSATAADRIFTLPSVGSSEDGFIINFLNSSNFKLTAQPEDTDSVWNSGAGYGIETSQPGAYCTLRYDHATTSWQPLQIGGGLWTVEALKIWMPCRAITVKDIDSTTSRGVTCDLSKRHLTTIVNGVGLEPTNPGSYPESMAFVTDEYITIDDSPDWDIFADNTQDVTIFARVRFDGAVGSVEGIVAQYEDANNRWILRRAAGGGLEMLYLSASSVEININGGTLSATTWYDVAFCRVGTAVGLYIDGTQVAFENSWAEDTLAGDLFIGQDGAASNVLAGRVNDVAIVYNNIFNAAPVVGVTDTITIPASINFVTGG